MKLRGWIFLIILCLLGCGDDEEIVEGPVFEVLGTVSVDGKPRNGVDVFSRDAVSSELRTDSTGTYRLFFYGDPEGNSVGFRSDGCRDTSLVVGQRGVRVDALTWRMDVQLTPLPPGPNPSTHYRFETDQAWIEENGRLRVRIFRPVGDREAFPEVGAIWDSARPEDITFAAAFLEPDTTGFIEISATDDLLAEGEESVTLMLPDEQDDGLAPSAGASLRVTILDRTPAESSPTFTIPLAPGTTWEFSTHIRHSDLNLDFWDLSQFIHVERTVEWGGHSWSELRADDRTWLYLRQEGSRIYGFFPGDRSDTCPLGAELERSLPWLIADFEAAAGESWTLVNADTMLCSEPESWCRHSVFGSVEALEHERVGTIAGVFRDVRPFALKTRRYCGSCESESALDLTIWFANDVGIVRIESTRASNCWSPACPDSRTEVKQRLRSWR